MPPPSLLQQADREKQAETVANTTVLADWPELQRRDVTHGPLSHEVTSMQKAVTQTSLFITDIQTDVYYHQFATGWI